MPDYAIIRTGGKQYRVSPGDLIHVEKLPEDVGGEVQFTEVLLTGGGDGVLVGQPLLEGTRVLGRVVRQDKNKKILVFKKKRRKKYRRRYGHRQPRTTVEVTGIESGAS